MSQTGFADSERKLGIAVSGGPDSLALLLLANAALPRRVEAATVDHGLRPEGAGEAAHVAKICHELGLPHAILKVEVAPGNVQSMARSARYSALTHWARQREIGTVATAHHADDQAETFLMRLNRGSGVAGLAGIRVHEIMDDHELGLVRPLLRWRHSELIQLVKESQFTAIDDPSNRDRSFDRVRIRQALADADWLDIPAIARTAEHLADADQALSFAAARELRDQSDWSRDEIRYRPAAPYAVRLRLIESAIAHFATSEVRGRTVATLLDRLQSGNGGNVAGVLVTVEGDEWVFRSEPPRRMDCRSS